jgi:hypothetical protein
MMRKTKKRIVFSIQQQMDILVQVNANKETHVTLAARLEMAPPTVKTTVKNRKDTNKCYIKYGKFLLKGRT